MLNIVIIDDEKKAINSLKWEIEQLQEKFDLKILASFTNPEEALLAIESLQPDCLFLDVEMPEMNGFSFLKKLTYHDMEVVITTAYSNFSLEAYKNNVLSYLLKPIDSEELKNTLKRVIKIRGKNRNIAQANDVTFNKKKLKLSFINKWVLVLVEDIVYCKSEGSYTEIFLSNGKKYVVSKRIKEIQMLLVNEEIFYRVHNSYLINIDHITEIYKSDGAYLMLNDKISVPISRNKKAVFYEYVNNFFH